MAIDSKWVCTDTAVLVAPCATGVDWRATYDDLAKLAEGRHFTGFEGVPLNKLLDVNMGQTVSTATTLPHRAATACNASVSAGRFHPAAAGCTGMVLSVNPVQVFDGVSAVFVCAGMAAGAG